MKNAPFQNYLLNLEKAISVLGLSKDDAAFCVAKGTGIALDHLDIYKKSILAKR